MRYIENYELREWVKDNLRKTIFQKAHALAVQTGCEILVKLEDIEAISASQYYASHTLDKVFNSKGLRKKSDDVLVSGETGLPVAPMVDRVPMVDRAIQSSSGEASQHSGGSTASSSTQSDIANIAQRLSSKALEAAGEPAVPMQLSLADDHFPESNLLDDRSPTHTTTQQTEDDLPAATSIEQSGGDSADLTDITVKLEPMIDTEPPDRNMSASSNGDNNEDLGTEDGDMSFSLDASNESMMDSSGMDSSVIASMTRDTKFYPVPISPKPYQCAVCQKAFRSVQVLQKHTQTFHMRQQHGLSSRRGRGGRGRGHFYKQTPQFQHHQFASTPTHQPQRFLCVICSRVFREAHLLEDHMSRSHHLGGGRVAPTQPQPPTSQSGFDESLNALPPQLVGDLTFPLLEDPNITITGNPSMLHPNLEDIPGPSSALDVSSIPTTHSQITQKYTQAPPSTANMPFIHPPPPVHRLAATSTATRTVASSAAGSSSQVGTPSRTPRGRPRVGISDVPITLRQVMAGIVVSRGPVNTHSAFVRQGPTMMRSIKKQTYIAAALELQNLNLGVYNTEIPTGVFLKAHPSTVERIIHDNRDLCPDMMEYSTRFRLLVPCSIGGQRMKDALISSGLLREDQFKMEPWKTAGWKNT